MNLSQLIHEAIERVDTVLCDSNHTGLCLSGEQPDLVKKFLKSELQTIVKESFKNTRVEERYTRDIESTGFNSALSDKHNKECEFLRN